MKRGNSGRGMYCTRSSTRAMSRCGNPGAPGLELRKNSRGPVRRKAADGLLNYVSDRRKMIRYPEFLAHGWQIGSGPMESQCRVVPDRVKGPGKRWDGDNAEAVMALEAMHQSRLWPAFWQAALN